MQGLPELSAALWFMAWMPIVLVLVLMMAFRMSGGKAGAVSWAAALLIGAYFFGGDLRLLASGTIKGLWTTVWVLYIIWGAMTLYNVVDVTGSFKLISSTFTRLTHGNKLLQLLVLGWAFPSFIQGVCGFGVPVAVSAPLLVGLGFNPIVSVVTALIGHSWAVTFGSLGSSYSVLVRLTDLDPTRLATFGAFFLGICCIMVGFCIAHYYAGWRGVRESVPAVLCLAIPSFDIGQDCADTPEKGASPATSAAATSTGFRTEFALMGSSPVGSPARGRRPSHSGRRRPDLTDQLFDRCAWS
jgi:lactate permease